MADTRDIGAWGEREAALFLRSRGFVVLHTNWRSGSYELDIVARKGEFVHFVEVKCRKSGQMQTPEESFDAKKRRSMLRAINAYIDYYEIDSECRVDLVAIETGNDGTYDLRLIEDVVSPAW